MTTISYRSIEIEVTPELTADDIRAYVSGYGYAFDDIDGAAFSDRAAELAQGRGLITASGVLTDEDEIKASLIESAREEIQSQIDEAVDSLTWQLEELQAGEVE